MPRYKKAFTGALSAGIAAAPSGNPFLIGGSAIAGAIPGLLEEEYEFDPNPFRKGFDRASRAARRQSRRAAEEVGNSSRASMQSKGIGGSELAQSLTAAGQREMRQKTEDRIAKGRADLEDNIAHAETYIDMKNQTEDRRDLAALGGNIVSTAHKFAKDNPFERPPKPEARPAEEDPNYEEGYSGKPDTSNLKRRPEFKRNPIKPIKPDGGSAPSAPSKPSTSPRELSSVGNEMVSPMQDESASSNIADMLSGNQNSLLQHYQEKISSANVEESPMKFSNSPEEIEAHIQNMEINPNSKLGQLYKTVPEQMELLERAFGIEWLKNVYTIG